VIEKGESFRKMTGARGGAAIATRYLTAFAIALNEI
jgi:hypothetical protein